MAVGKENAEDLSRKVQESNQATVYWGCEVHKARWGCEVHEARWGVRQKLALPEKVMITSADDTVWTRTKNRNRRQVFLL